MSRASGDETRAQVEEVDELDELFGEFEDDPQYVEAREDVRELDKVLDGLVALRRALRLTQKQVAARMGVGQSTVSGFETETSDPRLSTLMRYARAVEARLTMRLEMPAACAWNPAMVTSPAALYEGATTVQPPTVQPVSVRRPDDPYRLAA